MQLFFALTLLTSATLLFWIEPMFAKMVLPLLGGTPMVWNACMVFYQAVLLAGYVYAHVSTKYLGTRQQAKVHLLVLGIPSLVVVVATAILVLPIRTGTSWVPTEGANPILWLMGFMLLTVGFPFFVVSASAPMLQAWFADTGHKSAKDPYFLYAASNLGSMGALIAYPLLIERYLPLGYQTWCWAVGFGLLLALTVGCALLLWRSRGAPATAMASSAGSVALGRPGLRAADVWTPAAAKAADAVEAPPAEEDLLAPEPTLGLRLRWLALAFAPSSLFLGVTTFISTDVAAFPLLWVIPLALYLLTFVLVFSRTTTLPYRAAKQGKTHLNRFFDAHLPKWLAWVLKPLVGGPIELLDPHRLMLLSQPVILAIVLYKTGSGASMRTTVALLLAVFFVTAMVCHGELARSRPKARYLTEFYIWMSVGGMLGGMFNTLVAPLAFDSAFEFALVIAVACTLRPRFGRPRWPAVSRWLDLLVPCALFLVLYVLMAFNQHGGDKTRYPWVGKFNQRLSAAVGRDLEGLVGWAPKLNQWLDTTFPRRQQPAEAEEGDDEEDAPQLTDKKWELTEAACVLLLGGVVAFACQLRPLRFGLAVLMVLVAQDLWYGPDRNGGDSWDGDVKTIDRIVYRTRSFFGVMRIREFGRVQVSRDAEGQETEEVLYHSHTLRHGTTDHGEQRFDHGWQREPISYYFRRNPFSDVGNSPLADVFEKLIDPVQHREIGVCGLGTGTTAAYGRRGQRITYFEIDPAVVEIATKAMVEDPVTKERTPLFTFVNDSDAEVEIKLGDARLTLQKEPDEKYDLLIVDAFSSDAIPVHLLTREAVDLYFRKLKPKGILAVHISNRHMELAPVVGNIAKAGIRENDQAPLELAALRREDEADSRADKCGSDWIVLAREARRLAPLLVQLPGEEGSSRWATIPRYQKTILWTDDFSDIVSVLVWWKHQPAITPAESENK